MAHMEPAPLSAAELADQFGTDEVLGVAFSGMDGTIYSLSQFDSMMQELGRDNLPDLESIFPDGSSAVVCTNYAIQIARALPGRVEIFGFANEDNPTSRVAREEIHPGGHDFAVVDGRYLVDPWIKLVAGVNEKIVFDFDNPDDLLEVQDFYGLKSCWSHMHAAERAAYAFEPEDDPGPTFRP